MWLFISLPITTLWWVWVHACGGNSVILILALGYPVLVPKVFGKATIKMYFRQCSHKLLSKGFIQIRLIGSCLYYLFSSSLLSPQPRPWAGVLTVLTGSWHPIRLLFPGVGPWGWTSYLKYLFLLLGYHSLLRNRVGGQCP